jgi:hypothetical protein
LQIEENFIHVRDYEVSILMVHSFAHLKVEEGFLWQMILNFLLFLLVADYSEDYQIKEEAIQIFNVFLKFNFVTKCYLGLFALHYQGGPINLF